MGEQHVHHIISWVITGLLIAMVLGIWLIVSNARSYNDFRNEATTIIQRSGGLTDDAQDQIKHISDERYRDQFEVTTTDDKQSTTNQVSTGDTIKYKIHAHLRILGYLAPGFERTIETTSVIRAGSQPYQ